MTSRTAAPLPDSATHDAQAVRPTTSRHWTVRAFRAVAIAEAFSWAGLLVGMYVKWIAEASEIADAIVFLCSERASYVAGAAWSVDGGTVQVII